MTEGRDKWWDEEISKVPVYCPVEPMGSEDPLFILYVSRPCRARCKQAMSLIYRLLDLQESPRVSSTLPLDTSSELS